MRYRTKMSMISKLKSKQQDKTTQKNDKSKTEWNLEKTSPFLSIKHIPPGELYLNLQVTTHPLIIESIQYKLLPCAILYSDQVLRCYKKVKPGLQSNKCRKNSWISLMLTDTLWNVLILSLFRNPFKHTRK